MSILKEIVERKHYTFIDNVISWEDAVKISTKPLIEDGSVTEDYYKQIVNCIKKYGPYVVFDYEAAMPHSTEGAVGVMKTSVGLLISKEPISFGFDEDGEEKIAKVLFTLASSDKEKHVQNIQDLTGIFMNEELIEALKKAKNEKDILQAEIDFPIEEF